MIPAETSPALSSVELIACQPDLQVALVVHTPEFIGDIAKATEPADYLLVEAVGGSAEERSEIQNALNLLTHAEVEPDIVETYTDSFLVLLAKELYGTNKMILLIDTAADDTDGAAKLLELEQNRHEYEHDDYSLFALSSIGDILREEKMADQIVRYYRKIHQKDKHAQTMAIVGMAHEAIPELVRDKLQK